MTSATPCSTCGRPGHRPAKTWTVRCAVCHEARWPYLTERPNRYVCQRCRSLPPGTAEGRSARGNKARAARRGRASAGRSRPEA